MIARLIFLTALSAAPFSRAIAAESLFEAGTVLCSNFVERNRTCRAITTVTSLDGDLRYAVSRRMVAMPEENLLLETAEIARVIGNKVCAIGPTAEPVIAPDHYSYTPVLLSVYKDKRDEKLSRGVCHEYRQCADGWDVYVSYDDAPEPSLVSFTTVFGPNDPGRFGLSLRYREFGIAERTPSKCAPKFR